MPFEGQDAMSALTGGAYAGNGVAGLGHDGAARSDGSYTDQAQTLAMAAHVLNGYHPEQHPQHLHQQNMQGGSRHWPRLFNNGKAKTAWWRGLRWKQ
jgi:hypothetical protein